MNTDKKNYVAVNTIIYKDGLQDRRDQPTIIKAGQPVPESFFSDYDQAGVQALIDGKAIRLRTSEGDVQPSGSNLLPGEKAVDNDNDGFGDNPTTVTDENAIGSLDMDTDGRADNSAARGTASGVTKDSTATRTTSISPKTGAKVTKTTTNRSNKR